MIEKRLVLGGGGVWREWRLERIVQEIALGSAGGFIAWFPSTGRGACLPLGACSGEGALWLEEGFSPWAQGLGCRLPGAWVLSLHPPGFLLQGVWEGQGA